MTRASKVQIPDFFISLVLPSASRDPTEKECEELRQQTIEFWSKLLKDVYPKVFERLDLHFDKAIFGAENPEPRFNMYFEVGGDATFSGRAPTAEHVFGVMVGGNSSNFLAEYVRKVNAKSPFATAAEICVRRLIKKMPGGTVRAPSFCVAFASDISQRKPTEEEYEEYKKLTHKAIVANLKKAYPHNFVSCDLDVLSAEVGAQKPDKRFHLYLENDVSATFSSDPPSPDELFDVILRCSSGGTEYLISISEIEGSPFESVTMLKMQLIGLEMPQVEPLQPPEEGEGAGDEDESMEPIIVQASIFLALVLMVEPPASLPGAEELAEFRNLIRRFFYALIKSKYPEIFLDLHLKVASTKFGAGLPDERFNMCVEYDAEVRFRADSVPPDAMELRMLILQCNISSILAHVQTLKTLCFARTNGISMRRKGKKKAALIQDKPFEAAIELSDPPKEAKEKPKTMKPKKAKKKPKEIKPKKLEKKNNPAKKDPKTSSAPMAINLPVAVKEESTSVEWSDIWIAYKVDGVDSEPTPEDYEQLRQQTHDYFVLCLEEAFPKQFAELNLQIGLREFGAGKPDPKYNVYVEWDIQASFTSSSSSASKRVDCNNKISVPVDSDVPGPVELVHALLRAVDYVEYLVNHVRTIEDYAFANATAVLAQQRIGAT
jgi:hypothetical protein